MSAQEKLFETALYSALEGFPKEPSFSSKRFFSHTPSYKEQEKAISALIDGVVYGDWISEENLEILRSGELGEALRKFVQQGHPNDYYETKTIKTISDFVKQVNSSTIPYCITRKTVIQE